MWHRTLMIPAALALLAACSTPYSPPTVVHDSSPFPGVASMIAQNGDKPVDVVLVHGMCTHTAEWANGAIDVIARMIDSSYGAHEPQQAVPTPSGVQVVDRSEDLGGGKVRFHALVWSPLTAPMKHQLDFDNTGTSTNCANAGECKPKRAHFNAMLKDALLNDCLSDAMIYQGKSRETLRNAMIQTISKVIEDSEAKGTAGPLVVVAESLGSKILFDALSAMLERPTATREHELGQRAAKRLALVFMAGNQLPILGLAEQQMPMPPAAAAAPQPDSLQYFLELRRQQVGPRAETFSKLAVVAFTDPNDLLSYRLLPSRYQSDDVAVADVLVSNALSWLGMLEEPFGAHLDYLVNNGVGGLIACGWPRTPKCR